jgi:DNA-binding MarR family transcriptional regulator
VITQFLLTIILITTILMSMKATIKRHLHSELHQTKPFPSLEEEVHVQILYTAQTLAGVVSEALKPAGLSQSQFNVLRILRGARPGALPTGKIAERMVNRDPDLTRLLDRLEAAGLVEKSRDSEDRRVVNVRITATGLERLEGASKAVNQAIRTALTNVGSRDLNQLADLLEVARASAKKQID